MAVKVLKHRCPQNHPCPSLKVCRAGALSQEGFAAPVVDEAKCVDCNQCINFCPMGAFIKDN
ncbi:MAG: 4Fe-4S binding protein [Bacteroidota bacterium]